MAKRGSYLRIGLLLAATLAVFGFLSPRLFYPSIGSGPTLPVVPREPWSRTWSDSPVEVVGIGDSITAGFGAPRDHGYFDLLIANPADEFPDLRGICLRSVFPRLESRNLSVSGSISREHLEEQIPELEIAPSDVLGIVVLTTGGNDLIHDYGRAPPSEGAMYGATLEQARPWIASFEERLGQMFERVRERFPGGSHIFIADVYDPTDGVGDIETAGLPPWAGGLAVLEAFNESIRRAAAAARDVHVVGIHDAFLGHGIHCAQPWRRHYRAGDPHYWYYANLEDPNARGYDAIRRLFLLEIEKAMRRAP